MVNKDPLFSWRESRGRHNYVRLRSTQISIFICTSLLVWACGETKVENEPATPIAEAVVAMPKERSRVEFIAHADRLAVEAERLEGDGASALYFQAGALRVQSYRIFGKKLDGLEAQELFSNALDASSFKDCDAALQLIGLRGLMGATSAEQYRDYYLLRERLGEGACRERISRSLSVLNSAQPSPATLREWRQSVQETKTQRKRDNSRVVHESLSQSVVVPKNLRASLENPTNITKVETFGAERTSRVVVHVTHPTKFHAGELPATKSQGPRLFVDIEHAKFTTPAIVSSKGLIERVRLGKKNDATRVVLDLKEKTFYRIFYLPEPFRLVIDLNIDASHDDVRVRTLRRVVLDPGHGGHDPGAIGPNGLREKDVALDIAHRAAPLLAREVGVSTLLTRDVDAYVPLDERAARANAFHADLFLSIHLNSSEDPRTKGVMTFVLDSSRDAAASRIAARENSSTEAAAVELANSLSRTDSETRRAASETLAKLLQRAAGASLRQKYRGVEDHGVRRAGFYVLAGASMPAVLFEGSFISNPLEARRLNSEDYRQRLADALVNAVRAYRDGL